MSIINRTSKSARAIVITLVIAILSGVTLASKWESFVGFAEGLGSGNEQMVNSAETGERRTVPFPSSGLVNDFLKGRGPESLFSSSFAPSAVLIDSAAGGGFESGADFPTNGWTLVQGLAEPKAFVRRVVTMQR